MAYRLNIGDHRVVKGVEEHSGQGADNEEKPLERKGVIVSLMA